METRELKDYKWIFEKGTITLINKRNNNKMPLSLAKADSFVRAYISFKNRHRIEQSKRFHNMMTGMKSRYQERIDKLVRKIKSLKGENHG
jgi:hypothetical protein